MPLRAGRSRRTLVRQAPRAHLAVFGWRYPGEGAHQDALPGDSGPVQAAFKVSSPCFQLQGHSSSVCSASNTRRTSSGLRPTLRSVT